MISADPMRNWLGTPAIKSADGLCENPPTPLATKIRRPTSSSKANQYSTPPPPYLYHPRPLEHSSACRRTMRSSRMIQRQPAVARGSQGQPGPQPESGSSKGPAAQAARSQNPEATRGQPEASGKQAGRPGKYPTLQNMKKLIFDKGNGPF